MTLARAGAVAGALAVALAACTAPGTPGGDDPPRSDAGVQLFQWTWRAIATECTEHLGPAGYGWVMTSPPQEHVTGPEWWTAYQPVSYLLESRLGTREELAEMVRTCAEAGVDVYTDAVVNHMSGQDDGGTGWAGTAYEHYLYPGLYTPEDFHRCDTPGGDIVDYRDAEQVRTCELVNLADLATGTERVRERLRAYLADLESLDISGVRIDAAKHMPPEDVAAIVAELDPDTAVLQEVIRGAGEPVTPEQYLDNGLVYEFSYGRDAVGPTLGGSWAPFRDASDNADGSGTYVPADRAVSFVANHDTERNGSTLSAADGPRYALATVLLLTGTYGTPVVHSGYAFSDRDAGPELDDDGAVLDAACPADAGPGAERADGEWVCEHRWPEVRAAVALRAVAGDEPVSDWQDLDDVLAHGRGDRGFVAVNRAEETATVDVTTALAPGTYCDVVTGGPVGEGCSGTAVEVGTGGSAALSVPAGSAVVLHAGARPAG